MCLLERDTDLGFQVAPARCKPGSLRAGAGARPAEHVLKEVTEVGESAEISEINLHIATPTRWRLEICPGLPVRPEFVILFPFLRIRKDTVGFIYFFKLFLGILISRIDVGVVFSSKLPISCANLLVGGLPGEPKCFVVVPELNCHELPRYDDTRRPQHIVLKFVAPPYFLNDGAFCLTFSRYGLRNFMKRGVE